MLRSKILLTVIALSTLLSCDNDGDNETEKVYRVESSMTVDGYERTFILNLPPDYYESSDFALVIAMHGGGGNGSQFETTSLLTEKANEEGFVVVYPEGVQSTGPLGLRTWNAGDCCEYARDADIDDVKFISELINVLAAQYKIDRKKVYATGHSNGGMMSYRLACEIADKIAAIAVSGCSMVVTSPCSPSRPVPVLHMHSELDERVPHEGGTGVTNVYFPSLDSVLNVWSANNGCESASVPEDNESYTLTEWGSCDDGAQIKYYLTKDGGHAWPGGLPGGGPGGDIPSTAIDGNDLLWDFFSEHQLP